MSGSSSGPWRTAKIDELRTGDYALAMNPATGTVFGDRVWSNMHLRSEELAPLIEIKHPLGQLTVTPDHLLYVDGEYKPARSVVVGSTMMITTLSTEQAGSKISSVIVESVDATKRGRVANPLTHSGLLLIAAGAGAESGGEAGVGLLATSVLDAPNNMMFTFCWLPGFGKLASLLFPDAFQDSATVEFAIMLCAGFSVHLPAPAALFMFLMTDIIAGILWILWRSSSLVLLAVACLAAVRHGRSLQTGLAKFVPAKATRMLAKLRNHYCDGHHL